MYSNDILYMCVYCEYNMYNAYIPISSSPLTLKWHSPSDQYFSPISMTYQSLPRWFPHAIIQQLRCRPTSPVFRLWKGQTARVPHPHRAQGCILSSDFSISAAQFSNAHTGGWKINLHSTHISSRPSFASKQDRAEFRGKKLNSKKSCSVFGFQNF